MPIPDHIHELVNKELDRDELELFIMEAHNRSENGLCQNITDYVNGFTLAFAYLNRDKVEEKDRRWLRIRSSMLLANVLHKLLY